MITPSIHPGRRALVSMVLAGVLFATLMALNLVSAWATHACHFDQNQQLVCPKHEEAPPPTPEPEPAEGDRDGDGVPDDQDQCPDEAGTPEGPNGPGCPEDEDTASGADPLDIELEQGVEPTVRFECVGNRQQEELCLLQAFFPKGQQLGVVRAIDRCNEDDGGTRCQRRSEGHRCDEFGQHCELQWFEELEEVCDPNGSCQQRVLIDGPPCVPALGPCPLGEVDVGVDDAFEGIVSERGFVFQGGEDCRDDGSRCVRRVYRCDAGVCRVIGQTVVESGCLPNSSGGESCTTTTGTLRCSADGVCRVVHTIENFEDCNADRSACQDAEYEYVCDPPADERDTACNFTERRLVRSRSHTTGPGFERTQTVDCDEATDRCELDIEEHREESSGGERETVWVRDHLDCPRPEPGGAFLDCRTDSSHVERCPEGGRCSVRSVTVLERDAAGNPTRSHGTTHTDCAPGMDAPTERCGSNEAFEETCETVGAETRCTRTLRGASGETTWTGEEACSGPYESRGFDGTNCRTVERHERTLHVNEDGSVERSHTDTQCDPDSGRCERDSGEMACEPSGEGGILSSCRGSDTREENACDPAVPDCPLGSTVEEREEWEKTCDADGVCTRTGTRTSSECELTAPDTCEVREGPTSTFTEIQRCPGGEAYRGEGGDDPSACELAISIEDIAYPDGATENRQTNCGAEFCSVSITRTEPDGTVTTGEQTCRPRPDHPEDRPPYREGCA